MYKQLAALFARYTAAHLKANGRPQGIYSADHKMIGAIDVMTCGEGQMRLAGWTLADIVVVHMNGIKASRKATLHREDVARAHGLDPHLGFDFALPLGPIGLRELTRFGVEFHDADAAGIPVAATLRLNKAWLIQISLIIGFCCAMLTQLPAAIGWYVTRQPKYRTRIKQALRLTSLPMTRELDPDLFRTRPAAPKPECGITIVLPVFNAFDLLQEALDRVLKHTDLPWRLILIEDNSTDGRVLPFLKKWKSECQNDVVLLENKENLGFIQSVNRGLEKALLWGDPVVLLNSDALVPVNWASRLIEPMVNHKHVATVTPMSNDAEIFTVPLICKPTSLGPAQGDMIDAVAAKIDPSAERIAAPTGVGFCMAINPSFLRKIPCLDTLFGRGYGEEVDWCQRARAIGGKHLCVSNLFVEHRGGQSFGSSEKLLLIAANNQKISVRYPEYDTEVDRFVRSDPLRSTRLALALAWVGTQDIYPVSIYLAHSMGGGAEAYLQNRIAKKHHALGRSAVILRVGGKKRWQIELVTPEGTIAGQTDDLSYVQKMLSPISRRRIIYSCAVGDHDPAMIPDAILDLSANGRHTIEVLFHDYFPVSPSYTLLDGRGTFSGVPFPDDNQDSAHEITTSKGKTLTLRDWQDRWGQVISAAKEVVVFSDHSAEIVSSAYPQAADKISLKPHSLRQIVTTLPIPHSKARRVVGVLGDIGQQKGAALLNGTAQHLEQKGVGFVIVGNFDLRHPLPPSVPVHGTYKLNDLPQIAARYGITDWLIPSIWPETFSFTTHEALATGLPVHAFALGAQGDAVARAENGVAISCTIGENLEHNLKEHFNQHLNHPKRAA